MKKEQLLVVIARHDAQIAKHANSLITLRAQLEDIRSLSKTHGAIFSPRIRNLLKKIERTERKILSTVSYNSMLKRNLLKFLSLQPLMDVSNSSRVHATNGFL